MTKLAISNETHSKSLTIKEKIHSSLLEKQKNLSKSDALNKKMSRLAQCKIIELSKTHCAHEDTSQNYIQIGFIRITKLFTPLLDIIHKSLGK